MILLIFIIISFLLFVISLIGYIKNNKIYFKGLEKVPSQIGSLFIVSRIQKAQKYKFYCFITFLIFIILLLIFIFWR